MHGKRVAVELIIHGLAGLAEGQGIRGTARVFEVAPDTGLEWFVETADQLQSFSTYFLHELHLTQVQLDELSALLRDIKAGELSEAKAIERFERSPHWVWTACVVHQVGQMLAAGCVPPFLTDGFREYTRALLAHCGY
jgi:hypothetical protein